MPRVAPVVTKVAWEIDDRGRRKNRTCIHRLEGADMSVTDEAKSLIGGNLSGLAQKFKDSGLDEQVSSWISKGENMPIAGDQIKKVLGDETVAGIAAKLGIGPDEAADKLAEELPKAVDEQTPNGTLEERSPSPGQTH
jgi:uncharacterized protein YidB (DUF937 family)